VTLTAEPGGGVIDRVRTVLDAHWRAEGRTVPNAGTYPFGWLWDSCFHALVWAALGVPERAVAELRAVFRCQQGDGFVPHLDYGRAGSAPEPHAALWGRSDCSSITQPPMYGHAVAALVRGGIAVPGDIIEAAAKGLRFLTRARPRHRSGLVAVCHPWETGCDDSPRWDWWYTAPDDAASRYRVKGALVATIERSGGGSPLHNPAFDCAPAGFSALVAFNLRELAFVTGDGTDEADELVEALDARWDHGLGTWVDAGAAQATSGRIRTLDGLLPALVTARRDARALAGRAAADPAAFGGRFGPGFVHRHEPCREPRRYWRGGVWPPLAYLLALTGAGVGPATVSGALASGFAEYWDPDDGTAMGASPQSWAGLALLLDHDAARAGGVPGA